MSDFLGPIEVLQNYASNIFAGSGSLKNLVIGSQGFIRQGQNGYDAGVGFWLGDDAGTTKFSIGNSSGDKLTWNGTNLVFSGNLSAASGALGAITIGANAWHVDSSGNMWWGAFATYAAATIKISSAGAVNFTSGTFSGSITGATGTFSGALSGATGTFAGNLTANVCYANFISCSNKLYANGVEPISDLVGTLGANTYHWSHLYVGNITGLYAATIGGTIHGFGDGIFNSYSSAARFKYSASSYFYIAAGSANITVGAAVKASWTSLPKVRLDPDGAVTDNSFGVNNPGSFRPMIFDYVKVNGSSKIELGERFKSFIGEYDVFVNGGKCTNKTPDFFEVEGQGGITCFIVGIEKGKEDVWSYDLVESPLEEVEEIDKKGKKVKVKKRIDGKIFGKAIGRGHKCTKKKV